MHALVIISFFIGAELGGDLMILAVVRGFQVTSHGRRIRGVYVLRRAAVAPIPLLVLLGSVRG